MLETLRKHYGKLFYVLGAAHILVAIVDYRSEWADLFRNGFFDQIEHRGDTYQALGYWFFIFGPILVATGLLAQSHLDITGTLPRAFSWTVIATSFAAALAMYVNGMWLVGMVGILGLAFAKPARVEDNAVAVPNAPAKPVFEV